MECKKCHKECLESELNQNICKECEKENNHQIKNYVLTAVISVVISVIMSLTIIGWANSDVNLSDFKIESFNMETEKTTYQYSEDSVTYSGKGVISCRDKGYDYIVLLEEIDTANNKTNYGYVTVHNGTGKFTTYDSNYLEIKEKPMYNFNIIGFRSFKK